MKTLLAVLMILILAQTAQAGDWPMSRHDAAHTVLQMRLLIQRLSYCGTKRQKAMSILSQMRKIKDNKWLAIRIVIGITLFTLVLLAGSAGAAPYAYITNGQSNTVSVIDTATNTITATVPVGTVPVGVAVNPAGTKVYVANSGSRDVSVIDTATNTVTATVLVGNDPWGVAVNPAGTKVFVANQGSDTVSVIDTATNTVTATVPVGKISIGVAVSPAGTKVYVANYASRDVSVIDTATNTVTATVNLGTSNTGYAVYVAVNPAGTKVYVTNAASQVFVIDATTDTVTATVNVGGVFGDPWGVAVNPVGTKVYVANPKSNTVSVIDTTTNTVTATVNVGNPEVFGQFIGPEVIQTPTTGSISVSTSPSGASIYLDGSYQGTTSFTITNVAAGSHTITLKLTGYQDWSQTINVVAGQTSKASPQLTHISPVPTLTPTPAVVTATPTPAPPPPQLPYIYGIVIIAIVLIVIVFWKVIGSPKRQKPGKCPRCGKKVLESDHFCINCGETLRS